MTVVERLAERFEIEGWESIHDLPSRNEFETLHVDYKLPESCDGQMRRGDRQQLSRALSGFANSDGGIVVWGVDARSDSEGFDRVIGVHPICHLRRFVASLNVAEPSLVSPLVPGVRHICIESEEDSDVGVALSVIPASDSAPHMATGKDLQRYYRRSGSSFVPLLHHEIADLFGRRPHPDLSLEAVWKARTATKRAGKTTSAVVELHLRIRNQGRGTARYASLSLSEPRGLEAQSVGMGRILGSNLRTVTTAAHWWARVAAGSEDLVYPGDVMHVGHVRFNLVEGRRSYPDIVVRYSLVCDKTRAIEGELRLEGNRLPGAAAKLFDNEVDEIVLSGDAHQE